MNATFEARASALQFLKTDLQTAIMQAAKSRTISPELATVLNSVLRYLVALEEALKDLAGDCATLETQPVREASGTPGANNLRQIGL
jgi:hypothetical protein